MRHLNKKLAFTAAAAALATVIGVASAQTEDQQVDPMATPQQVDVNAAPTGEHILFFRNQGNSPETDPAAHLLLIKNDEMRPMPVAQSTTTTTTTVAEATTPADPAPAVVVNDTSANNTTTDTTAMPADTTPALAPKADRN
jgi:hypothetical protein